MWKVMSWYKRSKNILHIKLKTKLEYPGANFSLHTGDTKSLDMQGY